MRPDRAMMRLTVTRVPTPEAERWARGFFQGRGASIHDRLIGRLR
jgi:hypothetical protein